MPLELPGADHRILLVPRDEVVEFWSEDQARLFLSRYMHDPTNMSVLRSALSEECGSLFVHQMDDHDVVTQVARRMVGSCVAMVRVELPQVSQPGDAGGDAGWSPEELFENPLAPLEKAIEDVLPEAIIPPEFVRMAKREAEAIDWENKRYGFVIDALRHASQKLLDGSAVAPELPLLARQTGQTLTTQAASVGMALKKLAGAGIPKPDPSALGKQLVVLAGSQGTSLANGAKKVGLKLVEMAGKASDVLDKTALGQEFQQGAGKQARELVNKVGDLGKDMVRLADKAGAASDPSKVGPAMADQAKTQADKLQKIAAGTAPALDALKAKGSLEPGWTPPVNTNEFAFVLVDLAGKPVAGQQFKITVKGAKHEGTTGGDGKVALKGLPLGARGTLELPGCVWPWRDADGTLPGPRVHVVQKGEFLSKIAKKYGYGDWKKIYDHPANAPFRANRPDPSLVQVGDEICIPDAEPRRLDFKVGTSIAITHVGLQKPKLEIGEARRPGGQPPAPVGADEAAADAPATLAPPVAPPGEVTMAKLTGFFFETDKCFLLPGAMSSIKALKSMYDQHKGSEMLLVGHTDRAGSEGHNLHLSWERAEAVAAYLKDDAAAWMPWFAADKPKSKRWGAREVAHMLSALPAGEPVFYTHAAPDGADDDLTKPVSAELKAAVRKFQEWSNAKRGTSLAVDGAPGPMTQRALVAAYMDIDGTSLPKGTALVLSGLGESKPAVATGDGVSEAKNRRVEVFFFPKGVKPRPESKPAASATQAPAKAQQQYEDWKKQVHTQTELEAPKEGPKPPPAPGESVGVKIFARGDKESSGGAAVAHEKWRVRQADGATSEGKLDAGGSGRVPCAGETCDITFPRRGRGAIEAVTAGGQKAEQLTAALPAGVSAADVEALAPVRRREHFLRLGRSGDAVAALQRLLNAAGAQPKLATDGEYGPGTITAVRALQKRMGIDEDGVAGATTVGALDEALGLGTTFRCRRGVSYEFRWRRFPAQVVTVVPAVPTGPAKPAAPVDTPAVPKGPPPAPAVVKTARELIDEAVKAQALKGQARDKRREELTHAVFGDVEMLDEALRIGKPGEDKAVAQAVLPGFVAHGQKLRPFANYKNYTRLVRMIEALSPQSKPGDIARAMRRVHYDDGMLSILGAYTIGDYEPKVSDELKNFLMFEGGALKAGWQEIWGPRAATEPYRLLDVAHSLVAFDAWANNVDGRLTAWVFTDFGDWVTGLASSAGATGAGNNNAPDQRGNEFGEQLFTTQDDVDFATLSALLEHCFHPTRYLGGAHRAEIPEKYAPSRGSTAIFESDPAYQTTPKPAASTGSEYFLLLDTESGLVYRMPRAMYDELAKANKQLANIRKGIEDAKKLPMDQRNNALDAQMKRLHDLCDLELDLDPDPKTQKIPDYTTRSKNLREFVSLDDKKLVYTPGKLLEALEQKFKGQVKKDELKKAVVVEEDEEKKKGGKPPFEIKWQSDWKGQGDGHLLDLIDSSKPETYLPMILANPALAPAVLVDWVAEKYPDIIRKNHGDKWEWTKTDKRWDGGYEARFLRWAYDYQAMEVVLNPTQGQMKVAGKACGSVSLAEGKAELSYNLPDKDGYTLPLPVKRGARFKVRLVMAGKVSGFVGAQAELGYEAVADWSVKGEAKKDTAVPVQIGVQAGLRAFAGVRLSAELSLALEWFNDEKKKFKTLARLVGEGTAYLGVAAEFVFEVGWNPKKGVFTFELRAGVALKLGAGAAAKGEADVNEIVTFIRELLTRTDYARIAQVTLEAFQAFTSLCLGMAAKAVDEVTDATKDAVLAVGQAFASWKGEQKDIRTLAENINAGRIEALVRDGHPEWRATTLAKLCARSMILPSEVEEEAICRVVEAVPTKEILEKVLKRVDPSTPTVQGGIDKIDSSVDWGEQDRFDAVLKKFGLR